MKEAPAEVIMVLAGMDLEGFEPAYKRKFNNMQRHGWQESI
jgi:hypothetical protein